MVRVPSLPPVRLAGQHPAKPRGPRVPAPLCRGIDPARHLRAHSRLGMVAPPAAQGERRAKRRSRPSARSAVRLGRMQCRRRSTMPCSKHARHDVWCRSHAPRCRHSRSLPPLAARARKNRCQRIHPLSQWRRSRRRLGRAGYRPEERSLRGAGAMFEPPGKAAAAGSRYRRACRTMRRAYWKGPLDRRNPARRTRAARRLPPLAHRSTGRPEFVRTSLASLTACSPSHRCFSIPSEY
jgi:hypothetical protein